MDKYTKIQLSEDLRHWFGREVFATHGQHGTVTIMTPEHFEDVKAKLTHTQTKDEPGISEFLLAGISDCDITASGALYLPEYLDEYLLKKSDKDVDVCEVSARLLVLSRDPEVLKEKFIETLKGAEQGAPYAKLRDKRDVEVQTLLWKADDLRKSEKYQESIRIYLDALQKAKEYWEMGVGDELWQNKLISMACTGMGISYSKCGKVEDAFDNFADAVLHAPNEEAKKVAESNLNKLRNAVKDKTGKWMIAEYELNDTGSEK